MDRAEPEAEYHFLYKLLLVGQSAVGKSALLLRFADDVYHDSHASTIGVDFKIKTVAMEGKRMKLQIWDSAGQERFRTMAAAYYRGAHGIGIVFDLTDERSFENIESWVEEIGQYGDETVDSIVIGNKSDLVEKRVISRERAEALSKKMGMKYVETSAKTAENVTEAFVTMARSIYESSLSGKGMELHATRDGAVIQVGTGVEQNQSKKCC